MESIGPTSKETLPSLDSPLGVFIRECERVYLENALTQTGGNKTKAASLAGISLPTLRDKLSRYSVKSVYRLE